MRPKLIFKLFWLHYFHITCRGQSPSQDDNGSMSLPSGGLPEIVANISDAQNPIGVLPTGRAFKYIHVTPDESTHQKFRSILADPQLSQDVQSIKFTTSRNPYKMHDEYNNDEEESVLSESYEQIIRSIGQFPNLRFLRVEFSEVCSVFDQDAFRTDAEESVEFRDKVMDTVFSSLNDPEYPTTNLQALAFRNLQNVNNLELTSSPKFISTLNRLSSLRLGIVTEYDEASPESSWLLPQLYDFFAELPDVWLRPALSIQNLTIEADVYWGYMPKVDLRSLYFPNLKKLVLGKYVFSHDWQLEWILSHGETLEELELHWCPILSYVYNYGPADDEKYPLEPMYDQYPIVSHAWEYDGTWAKFFAQIESRLPNLKVFKFAGFKVESYARVKEEKYIAFNRGIGPSPWEEIAEFAGFVKDSEEGKTLHLEDRGAVMEAADAAAYEKLMATVKSRASG